MLNLRADVVDAGVADDAMEDAEVVDESDDVDTEG